MVVLMIGEIDPVDVWFATLMAELKQGMPNVDLRVWPECGNPEDIDVALAWKPPLGILPKLPNLQLIISLGAGVEHILRDPDLPSQIPIARMVYPGQISQMVEYVTLAVLLFQRGFLDYQQLQKLRRWEYLPVPDTQSFTVGILGLGVMGSTVAKRLRAIGFPVRGWSRTPKAIVGIDCFHGSEQLELFLSKCRVLVCLLPLTPATEGILNLDTFSNLPQGGYLINVARGKHLVEADLLTALDSGQIRGACLDTFGTEPLPETHPFWPHPHIIVTPHISAPGIPSDVAAQIIDNIERCQTGRPLKNVVDLNRGY
ncbi:MAG: glyoxylate/hydroxypyruvate reductase A [Symploca sp. SIO2E6]|nr:glyoxylate/hydroxypyruvate reductase A [Symploca sp. SIO2E6]